MLSIFFINSFQMSNRDSISNKNGKSDYHDTNVKTIDENIVLSKFHMQIIFFLI